MKTVGEIKQYAESLLMLDGRALAGELVRLKNGGVPFLGCVYSGLNLNQDKATKPQTVQIVRQGEATPYWFKFNPLYFVQHNRKASLLEARNILLAADVYSEREKSDIEAMLQAMLAEVNENA